MKHREEVLKVIYAKYEQLILNREFKIIEYSDNIFNFIETDSFNIKNTDIFELMPELIGIEEELQKILDAQEESFVLPKVFKMPGSYINIHIHQGKEASSSLDDTARYETLIVLLEDVTQKAHTEERICHERNETTLLLNEIEEKNIQLKQFNEKMQELVQIETKKNLEKQKMIELQSRYAQMGEMIGMITHQWKQPLTSIHVMASVLKLKHQHGKLDDIMITTFIQKLHEQTDYMNQTVNDFQHFFNPIKEKILFNIKKTLSTVVELIRYEYEMNNIKLDLTGDKELFTYGFPNEYSQVVLSILSNAKDAFLSAPHDNMKVSININAYNEKDSIVTIKDNAGGIPDEIIDTIFDMYITTKPTGSGLGLNIAKNIIEENMNGELKVFNTDDGAVFSIIV